MEPSDLETFYEDITSEKPDEEVRAEDIEERMRQAVADDPELEFVFEAMLEGHDPESIEQLIEAEDRQQVYQLRRKVRRRIRKAPSVPEK